MRTAAHAANEIQDRLAAEEDASCEFNTAVDRAVEEIVETRIEEAIDALYVAFVDRLATAWGFTLDAPPEPHDEHADTFAHYAGLLAETLYEHGERAGGEQAQAGLSLLSEIRKALDLDLEESVLDEVKRLETRTRDLGMRDHVLSRELDAAKVEIHHAHDGLDRAPGQNWRSHGDGLRPLADRIGSLIYYAEEMEKRWAVAILNLWSARAGGDEKPTALLVQHYCGCSWEDWSRAHRLIPPADDVSVPAHGKQTEPKR